MEEYDLKFRVGSYRYPVHIINLGTRLQISFRYQPQLVEEVKAMAGARWSPEERHWTVENSPRNLFAIAFLAEKNPYASYDGPLIDFKPRRHWCYEHQVDMTRQMITRRQCIIAVEMGCVTGDTAILTNDGPKTILSLQNKQSNIFVDTRLFEASTSWETGIKQIFKIITKEGYEIKATANHKFLVNHSGLCLWNELSNLSAGDKIVLHDHKNVSWNGLGTFEEGYIIGHYYGDGNQNGDGYVWKLWEKDHELLPYLRNLMPDLTYSNTSEDGRIVISSKYGTSVINEYGEDFDLNRSSVFIEGYIAGLFDTDGHALNAAATLEISQSNKAFLLKIQQALLFLGIKSSLLKTREKGEGHLVSGRIIKSKEEPWRLMIYGEYSHRFKERIGFRLSYKQIKKCFKNKGRKTAWAIIKSIEPCGEERVYDISVPEMQTFSANGFWAHNSGKTLSAIEALEYVNNINTYWIGPKSALYSVQLEFERWSICDICNLPKYPIRLPNDIVIPAHDNKDHVWLTGKAIRPKFYTYEGLRKLIDEWPSDKIPPQVVVFDESSRLKNPTAQRSQAALALANDMRKHWGKEAYVIEMSGSPAPKSPLDWYQQCEIACPGFIREGTIQKFQKRLAVIEQRESLTGGVYPHLVCWRDSENRCEQCGLMKDHAKHDLSAGGHTFKPCTDEVSALYRRMKGLVMVKFKKDILDLPEKQYKIIELKAPPDMLRAAQLINSKAERAIQALTLLRELSDGFQYKESECGSQKCPMCGGKRTREFPVDLAHPELPLDALTIQTGFRVVYDEAGTPTVTDERVTIGMKEQACDACDGTGEIVKLARSTVEVKSPKEDAFRDLLDLHDEVGRFVGYGGFTGSVDKCVKICKNSGWEVIRVDGRGWDTTLTKKDPVRMLDMFQNDRGMERCAFIGQPGAAGMGLNLTASPSIAYYSNDFNAESRIQSEDRIHRPGMNINRGATIYDFVLLPSDLLVINNLKRKRRLQDLSLGQMREEIAAIKFSDIRSW